MLNQQAAASAPPVPSDILSPEQAAKILNVAETDVVASLESGDLKGKKIGTAWRVTRAAVDQFLR
jgi:excisionase family DNA binding protein